MLCNSIMRNPIAKCLLKQIVNHNYYTIDIPKFVY